MSATPRRIIASASAALALLGAWAAPATAEDEFDKFAIESVSASLSGKQAGAHADMTIAVNLTRKGNAPYAYVQDIKFELPPGVIGNPQAVPRCSAEQLGSGPDNSNCPFETQVGITAVRTTQPFANVFTEPIYNMVPPKGTDIVARLGFIAAAYPTFVNLRIDPSDYSVIATAEGVSSATGLSEATTTIWGVPASDSHDEQRITPLEALFGGAPPGGRSVSTPEVPFLSNPTDCSPGREVTVSARSYQLPGQPSTASAGFPSISGCGKLNFEPSFTTQPTNPEAAAPTGLDTELLVPQDESPQGNSTSTMKSARVTLPEGFAINPAAGDGLEACSAEQVGYGLNAAANCPEAAKIGSIEAEVPALEDTLHGSVYQRTPEPGRLFGLWIVADEMGVHLKLPGRIEANPLTGQLSAVFDGVGNLGGLPQVPVAALKLNVAGGPRAPLSTPGCGTYLTEFSFAPWSGRPAAQGTTPMQVTAGCGKGGFNPKLSAGTLNPGGGAYTPFSFTLTRQDGEGNPRTIALHLPEGLLAKLKGVPLCPEAAAAPGTCPAASRLGSLTAASGVGGAPLWIPQPGKAPTAAYLAGPYKGAPYSVVSVVPAQAGPFDLGLVVNRAAIYIDPNTALGTVVTDPLPQILEGVPVSYRTVNVLVDRPEFTLNPTGCRAKQIAATITAADGRVAEPADGFQVSGCASLGFEPKLSLTLKGATKRGANPALRATLVPRPGDANSKSISVGLPHSAFLDQSHIRTVCTRVQFNAGAGNGAACPAGSVYGHARVWTPLLAEPLEGPILLRSSSNPLPDLILAVHGAIDFNAVGRIDSVDGGIRNTFDFVPDAPIAKVVADFEGGKKGLIVNSTNLCKSKNRALVKFSGQNGKAHDFRPLVKPTGCKGKKASKGAKHRRAAG